MKYLISLYKIIFKQWVYLTLGLVFLILYSLFNGVNIAMIKPVLDNVFNVAQKNVTITTNAEFFSRLQQILSDFFASQPLLASFGNFKHFSPLLHDLNALLNATESFLLLQYIVIFMAILFSLKNLFYYAQQVMFVNLRGKVVLDIRRRLFEKYLQQSLSFLGKNQIGDSMVRIYTDAEIVNTDYIMVLISIVRDTISIFVMVRIALMLNVRLFLISCVILPIFAATMGYLGKLMKKNAKKSMQRLSSMFGRVEEILANMRIVKAFAKEKYELERFKKINRDYFKVWRKGSFYDALSVPISEMNSVLIGMVVLLVGGRDVLDGTSGFTFGDFMAFMMAVFSILHPLKEISKAYTRLKRASVSLTRVFEILERKIEITDSADALEKTSFEREIVLNNVDFSYTGKESVLKNIDLKINKGERIAFVGSSGSGKTTIANLICRMYDVTEGEILIDGINIKEISLSSLRRLFGTVTQDSILFSDTIRYNIGYSLSREIDDERLHEAARIAYADEFIDKLPLGYNEPLYAKGANFSGGQKQRLCIARAVAAEPPILIFDEATSALDTESERKVQMAIEQATMNRTVFVIAHRLSTVLFCDRIVVMDKGEIVGVGNHSQLLQTCPRYKQLYDLQFASV